ncbi:FtsQ-type POTRA domain-containing protein [Microbacterium sp. KR10-403]|uniref:FtsQ-type POTRA domain-containing protein n=1 Tax=Microbacterium sp. KR10-403 TaxID=3158581 RepID=UPI0032E4E33E
MRRPTPLPAPPRVERPKQPEPPAIEPEQVEVEAEATAPIIPLTTGGDAAPAARDAAAAPAEPGEHVRWRDVWRASRARRRALRAEVRRFTARQRRRRIVWLSALGAVVLFVAGSFGAAYSPLFAVREIRVVGTSALDEAQVVAALKGQLGTPLPLVDEAAVKAALVRFPLVETYTLQAQPPHELVVRIVERTPVGAVKSSAGYTVVDAAGVALSTASAKPKSLPVLSIDGGTSSEAFRSAGQVIRSLPEAIRAKVTAVSATTPDDVTLTLGATGTKVVWGSADESARKGVVLQTLMKAKPPSKVSSYDVSSPDAVLVR